MPIQRIESLTFGVEDVEKCARFYQDFGLELVDKSASGADFTTQTNQTIKVRRLDDAALPPAAEEGSTLRLCTWGVDTAEGVDAIGAELSKDRDVLRAADGSIQSTDGTGYHIAFAVSQPKPVDVEPPKFNVINHQDRVNSPFPVNVDDADIDTRPLWLDHVVYCLPKAEWDQAVKFYAERLNFRLSDQSLNAGTFMRCESLMHHHNLALMHRYDRRGHDHISFEFRSFDDIMLNGSRMVKLGWEAQRDPGRGGLGSNMHWFFHNPCGGVLEHTADMNQYTNDWTPRVFEKHPGHVVWRFRARKSA